MRLVPLASFAFLISSFVLAAPAAAQTPTVVTGTITDPNGLPYSYARVSAQLIPTTATPTIQVGGIPVQIGGQNNATTDANGSFSMNLFCNSAGGGCSVISPSGTLWQFTVTITGTPPPVGTGPQSFSLMLTITGANQDISTNLNAAAAKLSNLKGTAAAFKTIFATDYGVKADWDVACDASFTIGSPIVTIATNTNTPSKPFTQADVGKQVFGSTLQCQNWRPADSIILPLGTILSVQSATQATVSVNATQTQTSSGTNFNATLFRGTTDDTVALNNFFVALTTQGNCGKTGVLPAGVMFFSAAIINTSTNACGYSGGSITNFSKGIGTGMGIIQGQGLSSSVLLASPNFNGNTCFASSGCVFAVNFTNAGPTYRDFSILGGGNQAVTNGATKVALYVGNDALVQNVAILDWGLGTGFSFQGASGAQAVAQNIFSECAGSVQNLRVAGFVYISDSTFACAFGGAETLFLTVAGSHLVSKGNTFGNTLACNPCMTIGAGARMDSYSDLLASTSAAGATVGISVAGTLNLVNANVQNPGGGTGSSTISVSSGGVLSAVDSSLTATAASGIALNVAAGGKYIDNCNNVITTVAANVLNGLVQGDCSVSGTAQIAANIALTSGWSSSTVGTVSGNTKAENWTVTVAGTPVASPVITVTFPNPFLLAPVCSIMQVGGTFTLSNPVITTTAAAATITWSGTPVAAQTYTFALNCGTP